MISGFAAASRAQWSGAIVVANERDNSLSFVAWPGRAEVRLPVPVSPHNVEATADGKLILATGAVVAGEGHAGHNMGGALVLVDPASATPAIVATIALQGHPAHVVADRQARTAFVTDADTNAVLMIDLEARTVAGSIPVGKYPHGLRVSPDGKEIYVANMRDGSVSVIDIAARRQVASIRVGKTPVQVGFTPDGKMAFVSLNGENAVAIIDTAKRAVIAKRGVGRGPVQVFSSADGKTIYVANQGSEQRPDNRLSYVPVSGGGKVAHVATGAGAHGVVLSPDGGLVAVTNTYAGTLSVLDVNAANAPVTIAVGKGPNGVTMVPASARP